MTDSASTTGPAVAGPLVSMVVPVYNTVTYLAETLESLLDQGLSESELEVVMVDDGSDDGSETMVDEYAARYPNFRAIHQEQSGGPASPCNEGIWASRGTYFFVLGADDVMAPGALRELVDVAEREGSDVVLAKLGSLGGRRTPDSVYTKTVLDADLVEHKIFNTLAAVKLFRRELVDVTGAFHPPHLRVGSDQPFVAALFLAAKKLTICADREYVLIRRRTDGSNITRTFRSPVEYVDLSGAVLEAIVRGTEPGPLRDGVVRRTFRREIPQIVGRAFLDLPDAEQRVLADRVRAMLAPVLNDATSRHLDPLTRTKIELLIEDDLEALRGVIEWETSTKNVQVRHDGAAFSYALPAELAAAIGPKRLHAPKVRGRTTLRGVTCTDTHVEIEATAIALGSATAAPETVLRLRHRSTEHEIDVPTERVKDLSRAAGSGQEFRARADLSDFRSGVWDAYVIQRFGEDEIVNRFGGEKAASVSEVPQYLYSAGEGSRAVGKLYFTRGPANLSIDLGFTLTKNELPEVIVRGVLGMGDGTELAIAEVLGGGTVEFLVPGPGDAWHRAPHAALAGGLYSVVLPARMRRPGASRRMLVRSLGEERTVPLPGSTPSGTDSASDTAGGNPALHEGEHTADILRGALVDLGVVARRSVRRVGREATSLVRRVRAGQGRDQR